jgi:CRP/FNR family cyclic AMP-dependent transcriptional regulator
MATLPGRRVSEQVRRSPPKAHLRSSAFDLQSFLNSAGLRRKLVTFRGKETVFTQGDPAVNIAYIQEGAVKLTAVNTVGKEGVVGILGPGDFFGERSLSDPAVYTTTATAIVSLPFCSSLKKAR